MFQYTAVNWFITHTTCTWHHFAPPANEVGNLGIAGGERKGRGYLLVYLALSCYLYEYEHMKNTFISASCSRNTETKVALWLCSAWLVIFISDKEKPEKKKKINSYKAGAMR